jgi:MYXO-CTERM domain-containing protein
VTNIGCDVVLFIIPKCRKMLRGSVILTHPGRWRIMRLACLVFAGFLAPAFTAGAQEVLVVDDPLNQSTTGVREGGLWDAAGGWQAQAGEVRITWDLGQAYDQGRFEVDVRNWLPCEQPNNEKCHIMSMWQSQNQCRQCSHDAGEAHWIFRTGSNYYGPPCHYKLLTRPVGVGEIGHEARIDHGVAWDASTTYQYSLSWGPDGRVVLSRDQNVIYDYTHGAPVRLRYLLIGRDRETKSNYGEQPGVIYSNVKVWVEGAPVVDAGTDAGGEDGGSDADADTDADTITVQKDPVEDTFAAPLEPDAQHGDMDNFQVGGDGTGGTGRTIYLKFDLRDISGEVQAARVHVKATNAGGGGDIRPIGSNAWDEETLTFNNRPTDGGAVTDDIGNVEIGSWYSWSVLGGLRGGDFRSFMVTSTVTDGAAFASKENADPNARPYLEITYVPDTVEEPGADGEDGGEEPQAEDAGVTPDEGRHDAGGGDPGKDRAADGEAEETVGGGCGCSVSSPGNSPGGGGAQSSLALMVLVALIFRRARFS